MMLLCLSSGARPRYREDVLRATSMPYGSHLQFRYECSLIPQALRNSLAANELKGTEVCIAYLDKSNLSQTPVIVPCRAATLLESKVSGDMYILVFYLDEFWVAKNAVDFNKEIHTVCANLPHWKAGSDVEGSFCQTMTAAPTSLKKTKEVGEWQGLVTELKRHTDFAAEPFFYFISSVTECGSKKPIDLKDGAYSINSGKAHEIRILQYIPGGGNDTITVGESCWLMARNEDKELSFITSTTLAIDSPYDERFFRFRSPQSSTDIDSTLTLLRQTKAGSPDSSKAIWDFDLAFRITANYWSLALKGLLIGVLIGMQGVISIYLNTSISDKELGYLLVMISGLAAGLIASFGLRKL
jgi:hypothetical protein